MDRVNRLGRWKIGVKVRQSVGGMDRDRNRSTMMLPQGGVNDSRGCTATSGQRS